MFITIINQEVILNDNGNNDNKNNDGESSTGNGSGDNSERCESEDGSSSCGTDRSAGHNVRQIPRGQRHEAPMGAEDLHSARVKPIGPPVREHIIILVGTQHQFGTQKIIGRPEV